MKHKSYLHQFTICVFACLFFLTANAQKKHFIYLQSEDKQPFYVMLNNKNYSSSMNGYLVIPKLKPGRYFFVAGFPKEKYPEQKFSIVVEDGKDLGFAFKRFGDKGWGLFDFVSFNTIMANSSDWEKDKAIYDTVKLITDDAMSLPVKQAETKSTEVANTSTNKVETITEAVPVVINTLSPVPTKNETVTNTNKEDAAQTSAGGNKYQIVKTYDRNGYQGIDQVYIDYSPIKNDTITVFIPYNNYPSTTQTSTTEIIIDTSKVNNVGSANQYNRSCVNLATDVDFAKTRKLMSYETTDDKMTAIAKRTFKDKCFTAEQIKKLGMLYLSEQSRCKFFIMSKPFVYDVLNYGSLETQFTLSSTIEQFRKSVN